MFLGHFGVAFAAKKALPNTSPGLLVFAAQFADLLWPILLLAGVEQVRIVPGLMAASPFDFTRYPISHSLTMELVWGAVVAAICFAICRNARSAVILGTLVPTHWLLDFIAHRPDMPLYPGGTKYGLGMWNSIPLTIAVEYLLFAAGIAIYFRTTQAKDRKGSLVVWSLISFLGFLYPGALFGPPPPTVRALAWSGLIMWFTLPWAAWTDRHRQTSAG